MASTRTDSSGARKGMPKLYLRGNQKPKSPKAALDGPGMTATVKASPAKVQAGRARIDDRRPRKPPAPKKSTAKKRKMGFNANRRANR